MPEPVVYMNPGTGPVDGASLDNAAANMRQLVVDTGLTGVTIRKASTEDKGGRYGFDVLMPNGEANSRNVCEVEMPGLPLEQVRYTGAADQNIWHYPRLYVDGSSWVWCYGVSMLRDHLLGEDDS